ncbi:MAG: PD-(D/E)XK nuclease family protein [Candidatus Omnitrophica bacterium]|nr:PD-(D/E)XK nuclease family protein [Candidatus Omnitrophota bacterium]
MKRARNLFNPASKEPYVLSRTRLENFVRCPRCFYLDRRLGIDQPPMFPYTLNSAVDILFKKEFDIYRAKREPHPLMKANGIDAVPYNHKDLNTWREPLKGIRYHHKEANFIITGGIDDVWENRAGELIIVDYKSTSTDGEVTLDGEWKDGYKRQMEIYQWLFRRNGFRVAKEGYFVYANALRTEKDFSDQLKFKTVLLKHAGNDSWLEDAILRARACLAFSEPPPPAPKCSFCSYRASAAEVE